MRDQDQIPLSLLRIPSTDCTSRLYSLGQHHILTAEAGLCTAGSTVTSVSCEQRPGPFPVRISIRTLRESVKDEIAAGLRSLPMF